MLEASNDVDLLRTQPVYPLLQRYSTATRPPYDGIYSSTAHHIYFNRGVDHILVFYYSYQSS
jgi:hypothetical protein